MTPAATIAVVSEGSEVNAVLPPGVFERVKHVVPARATEVIQDLRAQRTPVVAVLDAATVHLPSLMTEFAVRYPDVPLIVAVPEGVAPVRLPAHGVQRQAGSAGLVAAVRDACRSAAQQARVRTTLDRFNVRLRAADAAPDEQQQRRMLLSDIYLSSMLQQANAGIFVTDRSGVVALWNQAAERLFGVSAEAIVGRHIDTLGPDRQGPALREMITALEPSHPTHAAELNCRTPAGVRDLDISLGLIIDHQGAAIAVSGVARDVTERNALYRELHAKAEALAASNRHKEDFLAVLSHELRTPLNTVLGWARMLETMPHDEEQTRRGAQTIRRNAEVQLRLVMDLLDYARMAAGQLALHPEPRDLSQLTHAAVDAMRPELERHHLSVGEEYERDVVFPVDAERVHQVLTNLIGNAIKFTPDGGRISVRVARTPDGARIQVSDNGRGIRPEFLPHVFDEFRQADASATRTEYGLGLGLAITRRIVELHGGTVRADSEGEGRGATFTVTFGPRLPLDAAAAPAVHAARQQGASTID